MTSTCDTLSQEGFCRESTVGEQEGMSHKSDRERGLTPSEGGKRLEKIQAINASGLTKETYSLEREKTGLMIFPP